MIELMANVPTNAITAMISTNVAVPDVPIWKINPITSATTTAMATATRLLGDAAAGASALGHTHPLPPTPSVSLPHREPGGIR